MEEANPQDLGSNSVSMEPISTVSVSMDEISSSSSSVFTTTTTAAAVTVSENTQIKNQVWVSNTGAGSLLQPLVKCSEKVLGEKNEGEKIEGSVSVNKEEEEEEKQENGGVVLEQVEIHKEIRVSEMETVENTASVGENGGVEEIHKEIRENPEAVESPHENGGVVILEEGKTQEEEIRVSSSLEAEKQDLGGDMGRIREHALDTAAGTVEPFPRVENNLFSVSASKEGEAVKEAGENGVGLQEGEAEKEVRVSEMETVEDVDEDSNMVPVDDDESMDDAVEEPSEEEEEEDVSGDVKTTGGAETEAAEEEEENMVGVDVKVDSSLAAEDISGDGRARAKAKEQGNNQVTDMGVSNIVNDSNFGSLIVDLGKNQVTAYDMGVSNVITSSVNDSNFGSLVVDLGILQNMDEFVKHNERNEVVEKGGNEFSASDLVWGQVKSHPWWPGQIFDPQAASKLAKKHQKHDRKRLLVAYFWDRTFAWNVASSLKPFEAHFSQMEKQTDMEEFRLAIWSALGEISRRVQRGLLCSCVPDEACSEIKSQIIANAGIRADSSRRDGVDKNVGAAKFEPCKIVEYVKNFALDPLGGVCDKIENVVTQAQLAAFYRSKGHPRMAEFGFWGGLLDTEIPVLISINEEAPSEKRKLESQDKPSSKPAPSSKKRKSVGSFSDDLAGKTSRVGLSQSSNEDGEFRTPVSFKVGESLRRVANQLKGSPPILNSSGGRSQKSAGKIDQSSEKLSEKSKKRKITIPKEYSDPDEMLSQLHLAARDPMKGYSFLTIIVGFFTDYRNSINLDQSGSWKKKNDQPKSGGGGNRKLSRLEANAAEIYSDEEDDPYCANMISGGTPEEQSPRKIQKRKRKPKSKAQSKKDSSIVELEQDPPSSSPSFVVEEYSSSEESEGSVYTPDSKQPDHDVSTNLIKNDADDLSPTALILNFTQAESIPLETDLNKIFSRFGPLLEADTEVTRKTCCAKVVFKNRSDAEVAFSSAGKFSIFGPALASYQLSYLPSTSSAPSPVPPSAASTVPLSTTSPTLTFEETN